MPFKWSLLKLVGDFMDLRKLKTLIDLVSESNVSELEITEAEGKIRIVKAGAAMVQPYATPVVAATPGVVPVPDVAPVIVPAAAIVGPLRSHTGAEGPGAPHRTADRRGLPCLPLCSRGRCRNRAAESFRELLN